MDSKTWLLTEKVQATHFYFRPEGRIRGGVYVEDGDGRFHAVCHTCFAWIMRPPKGNFQEPRAASEEEYLLQEVMGS